MEDNKKINKGYSINIYLKDGECLEDLYFGIDRFFEQWMAVIEGKKPVDLSVDANVQVDNIKRTKPVDLMKKKFGGFLNERY